MLGIDSQTVAKYVNDAQLTHIVLRSGERRYVESEIAWLQKSMTRRREVPREFVPRAVIASAEVKRVFDGCYDAVARLATTAHKADRTHQAAELQSALYELADTVERWTHFDAQEKAS